MNKIFKVIWNEARNAYVVVSEIAKNHGSKSCSTKKLLAMLIATGVMTCASFDVLAEKPVAATTAAQQYVALKAADFPATGPSWRDKDTWGGLGTYIDARDEWKAQQNGKKQIGKYTYTYDGTNKYWVRKGYVLTVDENGGKYTQLSQKDVRADVAYTGTGVPEGILQSVTSTVEYNGVVTHSGDSLQKVTAGSYAGVSNSGGTGVVGSWNYIIKDSSWEGSVDAENHQDGYVDLIGNKMPKGFITTGSGLEWDEAKQTYTYQGKAVDYRNMYVIDGKLGVFTNANGSEVYTGTVYGKNNEILMTVKDNGKFYSYWAASVTDPSATMETYPVSKYNSDLAVIDQNIKDLNKDIIKEVTLTKGDDSAIIRLVRNGGNAVDGAITVTSGGGTGGNDTFVKISNAADAEGKTFATGSKVEAIGSKDATTGIKINGEDYTIKSGSKVSVTQNADEKTTTITVDGTETTITDTDTTYTEGDGIAIDKTNKNAISVKLKEGENNLEVTEAGLELKKALTVNSVKAGDFYMSTAGIGYDDKAYITSSGLNANSQKITGVAAGTISEGSTDAVNGSQLKETNTKVENLKVEAGKHTTLFNGENTTVELVGDGKNGKQYKVNVDLSQYAKTEDVAVVYDKNKTSLRSTNATLQTSSKEEEAVDSIALGKDASAVKESVAIGNGASVVEGNNGLGGVALGYKAHAGYKGTSLGSNAISGREGTTLVGANTNSGSLYTTVVGTDSVINSDGTSYKAFGRSINVQGATATVVGSKNTVDNKNGKVYSGVANNVMGSANTIEGSNGVTIQGTGNKVTDAYKDMNIGDFEAYQIGKGDYSALAKKKSGAVAVIGGANTVSRQTDSTVIGYDNRLIGGEENISHDVFMAGSHNELTNVSDSIVMGNDNTISDRSNVISFGHQNTISASNAVAIGNGAGVSVEGGVALGVGSVASTAANALGYGAAEGETGIAWKATNGAVSVGSSVEGKKITRQITNVAAGTEDTDAVNVAQLKKVSEAAASASQGWKLKTKKGNASDVKPGDEVEFDGDANIQVSNDGNKVSVALKNQLTGIQSITGAGEGAGSISFADGGNVKVNDVTIEKGGKITGVAAGEAGTDAGTDAVNVSQLNKVSAAAKTEVVKGTNIASVGETTATDGHTVYTVNAKGTSVSVDGNFNLVETTDAATNVTNYGISLKDSVTIGGTHAVTINGTDGTVTGLTNTTWNKDSITSGRAATEDQLQAVATEAGKHTTLSDGKNTTVESTVKDGQTDYKVNVAGDLTDITSVANGDSKINLNKDSIIISNGNKYFAITNSGIGMRYIGADYSAKSIMLGENGTTISGGLNVAGSKITGVAAGEADTDAVNVGQLNAAVQAGNTDTHIKAGEYGVGTDNKVNMQLVDKNGKDAGTVTITDVAKASDVGNVNNIADDIKNGEGHTTVVDAVNNLNQKLDNKVGDLNYVEGGKGNYVTNGENTTTSIGKLDQALKDVADTANQGWNLSTNGGEASKVAPGKTVDFSGDKNIKISNDGTNVEVKLNEVIDVNTVTAKTVTTGNTVMNSDGVKVGADVSLNQNGLNVGKDVSVTATAVTAGKTSISDEGVKVGDKTYISADGLNANGQHITNVKAGEADTDAVNYGQLKDTNNRINGVENQVISNSNRINQLGNRVNKVGAGAAALAALHPMDFDPDDKLTFSAGYGNYGGENAAAIGAYYRPDEKVMFSVGGTVGNGENMVNAGVSFALDRTNHVSNSRTALAREVIDLRGQLAVMGAKMAKMEKALGMLDETKTKLFPDIPANHWAYEYIAKLAGNGYIEGYPDGNFGGDRLMTRYEFAAMLYRAIENGAALEEKIIKEFEPELGRIRVDRISGEDGDRDKIERVRVNDTKGERDHYGNKLAK